MSLRPIDLQTLFMRQTELSREQAALHDGTLQKKATEMAESVEETLETDDKVRKTDEIPNGPEEVKEEGDRADSKQDTPARKLNAYAKEAPNPQGPEVVKDPTLGKNVDISG